MAIAQEPQVWEREELLTGCQAVSQAVRLGAIGLVVGLAGAFGAARVLDSLLFGVTATDPLTFAAVCATLLTVLLLAAYLPARRATRVDPMIALRTE